MKEKKLEHDRKKAQLNALEENWMVFKDLQSLFEFLYVNPQRLKRVKGVVRGGIVRVSIDRRR